MPRSIDAKTLVRDIVRAHPGSVRALDRFRLDWCYGAQKTLAEACASARVPLADVVLALADEPDGAADDLVFPPTTEPLTGMIGRVLTTHHALSRSEGPRLRELSTKVARKHGSAHPALLGLAELVHGLFDELGAHMDREERVLFPYIEALEKNAELHAVIAHPLTSLRAAIHVMNSDHAAAGRLLDDIAQATEHFTTPPGACGSWTSLCDRLRAHDNDLRRHVWLENEVLFPRALELERLALG